LVGLEGARMELDFECIIDDDFMSVHAESALPYDVNETNLDGVEMDYALKTIDWWCTGMRIFNNE